MSNSLKPAPEKAVLLPVNNFLEYVPVSRSALYAMIRRNELRSVMVGGRRLIPRTEADRLASGSSLIVEASAEAA